MCWVSAERVQSLGRKCKEIDIVCYGMKGGLGGKEKSTKK